MDRDADTRAWPAPTDECAADLDGHADGRFGHQVTAAEEASEPFKTVRSALFDLVDQGNVHGHELEFELIGEVGDGLPEKGVRHERTTPLRLQQAAIDWLVEPLTICCSHHDAFRFFAEEILPMNRLQPTLESRVALEQSDCIHANLDLYKRPVKSMPWIDPERLSVCFEATKGRRICETEQRRLEENAVPLRGRFIAGASKIEV